MIQEQREKVGKQDIINYINNMEIKKSGFGTGGLDKADVYYHLQQIVTMYDAFLSQELEKLVKIKYGEKVGKDDIYIHIQQLVTMYDTYLQQEQE
jgi:hypothetical protein